MWRIPNTTAILGNAPHAADLALCKVLKFKECSGPVVILDFTGRGAMILGKTNMKSLLRRPVIWCDMADRRFPIALFHLHRSDHFRLVLSKVLCIMREISKTPIADTTIKWAVEVAYNLSKDGSVGLGALLRTISSPEIRRWFLDTQNDPNDLSLLIEMIFWALHFPSVYAISESINRENLEQNLQKPISVWIESHTEHFEKYEHMLIAVLMEAAVENAVRAVINFQSGNELKSRMITIVHLFPLVTVSSEIPVWVKETSNKVRHICVHKIESNHPLNSLAVSWATEASNVWVIGKTQTLNKSAHKTWLNDQEIDRINSLDYGDLWIKSNESNKFIVTKIGHTPELLNVTYKLRQNSTKLRKVIPVRQMTSAIKLTACAAGRQYGLYQTLCEFEILRMGWLKVKNVRKDSCGIDGVTITRFKENLEDELSKLAYDLKNMTYRCNPLRRVYLSKPDGGKRAIGVMCIRDRVVQSSCLMLMEPIFEPIFSRYSFAFRPRRNAHQALAMARSMIASNRQWIVTADIKKCFDSIDHEILVHLVSRHIGDQDLLNLIQHWLTVDVLMFNELIPVLTGVPQGETLSPLLANIYLDPLDRHLEKLDFKFVRYADDIIILTSNINEAQKALQIMENFLLDPLHLQLKPAKTNYVLLAGGFDFLGFTINQEGIKIKQQKLDDVLDSLHSHIKTLGHLSSTLDRRVDAIIRINGIIRGFRNYFALPDENLTESQMRFLDGVVEEKASNYLTADIRDDPVWICRERFYQQKTLEDIERDEESEQRKAKIGVGYPETSQQDQPAQWMIKEDPPDIQQKIKPSVVIENTDNESEDTDREKSIIENKDRLYILTHGSYLTVENQELIIKKRKTEIYRRRLNEIGLVYLQGFGINISVNLQLRLAELDIPAVFAPPTGSPIAILNPLISATSYLRGRQVLRRDDPDVISAGLNMISAKAGSQAAVLRYFSKYRKKTSPDLGWQLIRAAEGIGDIAGNIRTLDPAGASVRALAMGYEGSASASYWRTIIKMLPKELGFSGRVTKSAKDIVNQCLNYTYGILYGEVWRAIVKSGLDPYFGIMHGSKRDQGSLVFDLIEEFRAPFADRLVIGMLGRGFRPRTGNHGFLKTSSKRRLAIGFSKKWLKKMTWRSQKISPAAILEKQAQSLVKLFNYEGNYHPYKMRW